MLLDVIILLKLRFKFNYSLFCVYCLKVLFSFFFFLIINPFESF